MLDDADDAPLPDPYVPRPSGAPRAGSSQPASPSSTPAANETPGATDPAVLSASPAPDPALARGLPYQPPAAFQAIPASPYASWALVVGILGLICFGAGPILGLIAIVLGILGWRQVSKSAGAPAATLAGRASER